MKAKKLVAVMAATVMAASTLGMLAGCGGNDYKISILLLANETETAFYRQYFKDMEDEINEGLEEGAKTYKIEFEGLQEGPYYDRLKANINGGGTPDIFYLRPNELLQYKNRIANLQDYADTQDVADLSLIYDTALDMYRFNPQTGEIGNKNDDLYAFPKDLSTQQLGYNKTLLSKYKVAIEAAGYTLPWDMDFTTKTYTWDEYKGMCEVIAKAIDTPNTYASDIPSVEILAYSMAGAGQDGKLIDLSQGRANGKINNISNADSPINKAIKYQAELVDCGAADYLGATYTSFTGGKVCFYGLMGSWEVKDYNDYFNKDGGDNWGLMPWPTVDGSTNWAGVITSAGYVVSKDCANKPKGEYAKMIAASFMSTKTQDQLMRQNISLPLIKSWEKDYVSKENDAVYKPSTRQYFLDVISGEHGFFPAKYSTYDTVWLKELNDTLDGIWRAESAVTQYQNTDWSNVQSRMQQQYDNTKNR